MQRFRPDLFPLGSQAQLTAITGCFAKSMTCSHSSTGKYSAAIPYTDCLRLAQIGNSQCFGHNHSACTAYHGQNCDQIRNTEQDLRRNGGRACRLQMQLEGVDQSLFQRLRDGIASRNYTGAELRQLILKYAGGGPGEGSEGDEGYDALDALTNGFLLMGVAPEETRAREPGMVFYQPTPARVVLELVEKADFRPHDVFYDIGSGLGQVAILVHLLSGVRAKGVEFEPAYCDYARRCARELNLSKVEFINADAREADYSDGIAFFMYTPFEGEMLEQVLERLEDQAGRRGIRLYTYGPCTSQVARQSWLERVDHNGSEVYKLATFETPAQALEAA